MYTGFQQIEIETPHDRDVLSGRGNFINMHPGNNRFRYYIQTLRALYNVTPKSAKPLFAKMIVSTIRNLTPPGRFLKKDSSTQLWSDIGEKKALYKTRQALREKQKLPSSLAGMTHSVAYPLHLTPSTTEPMSLQAQMHLRNSLEHQLRVATYNYNYNYSYDIVQHYSPLALRYDSQSPTNTIISHGLLTVASDDIPPSGDTSSRFAEIDVSDNNEIMKPDENIVGANIPQVHVSNYNENSRSNENLLGTDIQDIVSDDDKKKKCNENFQEAPEHTSFGSYVQEAPRRFSFGSVKSDGDMSDCTRRPNLSRMDSGLGSLDNSVWEMKYFGDSRTVPLNESEAPRYFSFGSVKSDGVMSVCSKRPNLSRMDSGLSSLDDSVWEMTYFGDPRTVPMNKSELTDWTKIQMEWERKR